MRRRILLVVGTVALLALIFGTPAVLIPVTMDDVPNRSKIKVFATYQDAIYIARQTFAKQRTPDRPGRLMPVPEDTKAWIELINPMGRKAPGGGLAVLPVADPETGALGIKGDATIVVVTMPAYRDLTAEEVTVRATP